jgi:hypothetical protein
LWAKNGFFPKNSILAKNLHFEAIAFFDDFWWKNVIFYWKKAKMDIFSKNFVVCVFLLIKNKKTVSNRATFSNRVTPPPKGVEK